MNDGGPAFPRSAGSGGISSSPGMTLRDWFAGMALAECPDPINEEDAPRIAALAYAIADAMLKAREG